MENNDIDRVLTSPYNSTMTMETNDTLMEEDNSLNSTFVKIELYWLPVVCSFGLVGNTLSTVTFLRQPLRNAPCSLYLAVRGISDNGFLCSLLLVWISIAFDLRLSQVKGVCQLIIFMTYICGCISVWLCVFITFENTLMICNPFIAKKLCVAKTSKICICTLTVIAIACYNTSLWIVNSDCSYNPKYTALTQTLVYTDTIFTLVLPLILISVLLLVILYQIIFKVHERQKVTRSNNQSYFKSKASIPIKKVTKMLLVVSLIFFILNVPSHVIRIKLLIGRFLKGQNAVDVVERNMQTVFLMLYYLSFSVNFVVYVTFGSNFRSTFTKPFIDIFRKTNTNDNSDEALNLVRNRRHSYNDKLNNSSTSFFLKVEEQVRSKSR